MTHEDQEVLVRFHRTLVREIQAANPEHLHSPFTVAEIYQNLVPYRTHRDQIGVEMSGDYEHALLRLLAGEGEFLTIESRTARQEIKEELESPNPNTGLYRDFAAADVRLNPDRIDEALGWAPSEPEQQMEQEEEEEGPPPEPLHASAEEFLGTPGGLPALDSRELPFEVSGQEFSSLAEVGEEPAGAEVEDVVPLGDLAGVDREVEMDLEPAPEEEPSVVPAAAEASQEDAGPDTCPWCRENLPRKSRVRFCPFCGSNVKLVPCPACGEELEVNWRFCVACGTEVSS